MEPTRKTPDKENSPKRPFFGWEEAFVFPVNMVPYTTRRVLEDRTIQLRESEKNELVSVLFNIMVQYGDYPWPKHYSKACMSLVQRFPLLLENDGKSGFECYKAKLSRKFAEHRRQVATPERLIAQAKFTSKKSKKSSEEDPNSSAKKTLF
ncbi:unnamed protein product [Brachionus calyciflorus]|uniref:Uncharacterized protein n=1 Tax=Brachionus calyciflorus TaxID=104777 RepID=A0A814SSG9_9BILA|nr:unnamed protein product [Brachionus calyciflorus]